MENIKEQMVEKLKIMYPELKRVPQKFLTSDFVKNEERQDALLTVVVRGIMSYDIYECHYFSEQFIFNKMSCPKHLFDENIFLQKE